MAEPVPGTRTNLLTISLEDYFHVGAFHRLIQSGQWYRFESRLERNTMRTLDLLDEYDVKATFFSLGWVAEHVPELVRTLVERGHEVANRGFYPRSTRQMTPEEFRDDLAQSGEALERACGQRMRGYRAAKFWSDPADLWPLRLLADAGYAYDSSILPVGRRFAFEPRRYTRHVHAEGDRTLVEFPIATTDVAGFRLPVGGGNYLRQLPRWLVRGAAQRWMRSETAPFVMYFQVWELDPEQPQISAAPFVQRVRQYRNLPRMEALLRWYFERYRFTSAQELLGLPAQPLAPRVAPAPAPAPAAVVAAAPRAGTVPVTIVVPCFNEEGVLPYLANTLQSVGTRFAGEFDVRYVFVDDRSTDGTWAALQRTFGAWPNVAFVRHERNGGVAAAIMTGIAAATTEIVCSIDADCTYDPHELAGMIRLLTPDVTMVTASPYHPQGLVRNVAGWRLVLSRGASALYRRVLHNKLYTYTSCFRVYRRSAVADLTLTRRGFLGVMETVGRLDLEGHRIVEYPTVLEVRMLGQSKMQVVRTIRGHLQLLAAFAWRRLFGPRPHHAPPAGAAPVAPGRHEPTRA